MAPIPGTTQMAHLVHNIGATGVAFSDAELDAITISGARIPDFVAAWSGVEAPPKS